MNFFDHKDLGNHLLQLCPKVVKHPVYVYFCASAPLYIYSCCYCSLSESIVPPPSAKFNKTGSFDVLLTVYLSIISVINQLHAQILVL